MAKYFKKVKSYKNLKEQYKALLKKNHPDNGGEVAKMQEINAEYDALFRIWKDRHESETGETVTETAETTRSRFYTENGWAGSNYNSSLDVKDVSKIVKTYIKEKYPTWKFSVRISRYSGGCSLRVECLESPVKMYKTADDLRAEGTTEHIKTTSYDGEPLEFDSIKDEIQDIMRKLHANGFLSDSHTDEEFFTAYEKAVAENASFYAIRTEVFSSVLEDVKAFTESYRYSDCDGMIDYFSTNFWTHYHFNNVKFVEKTARIKEPKNEMKKADAQSTQTKKGSLTENLCKTTENENMKNADADSIAENVEENKEEKVVAENATTTAPSFEDLARAFVAGKTVKTQKKEEPKERYFTVYIIGPEKTRTETVKAISPEDAKRKVKLNSFEHYGSVVFAEEPQEQEEEPKQEPKPQKAGYGYEESSDFFTDTEITDLENGKQVTKPHEYRKNDVTIYFSTPYTLEGARIVYELSTAGYDAHYRGFIVNHKFYNDKEKISEEMKEDINTEVKRLLPSEQDAEKNAGEVSDYEKEQIDFYRNNDFMDDAQRHFYKGTDPELILYHPYNSFSADECIKYLLNPTEYTQEQAKEYIGSYNRVEIVKRYMQFNRTAATLAKIKADKDSEPHKLKKIMDCIREEKTVKILLANGNTIKVEADAVKRIGYCGYINSWDVTACDRQYLEEKEVKAEDIKQITHGQRVLYKVA